MLSVAPQLYTSSSMCELLNYILHQACVKQWPCLLAVRPHLPVPGSTARTKPRHYNKPEHLGELVLNSKHVTSKQNIISLLSLVPKTSSFPPSWKCKQIILFEPILSLLGKNSSSVQQLLSIQTLVKTTHSIDTLKAKIASSEIVSNSMVANQSLEKSSLTS